MSPSPRPPSPSLTVSPPATNHVLACVSPPRTLQAAGGWSRAALGTREDTLGRLQGRLRGRLPAVARAVAAVAAHLLLRLAHDARLPLDPAALGDALLRRLAPLQVRPVQNQYGTGTRPAGTIPVVVVVGVWGG